MSVIKYTLLPLQWIIISNISASFLPYSRELNTTNNAIHNNLLCNSPKSNLRTCHSRCNITPTRLLGNMIQMQQQLGESLVQEITNKPTRLKLIQPLPQSLWQFMNVIFLRQVSLPLKDGKEGGTLLRINLIKSLTFVPSYNLLTFESFMSASSITRVQSLPQISAAADSTRSLIAHCESRRHS